MKNLWFTVALSSIVLSSCGGSGEGSSATPSETSKSNIAAKLTNTSWLKECSPYNKLSDGESTEPWNVKIKLTIDSTLKATYRSEFFHPNDTECNSMMFDALNISKFEISGKVISDESIDAYRLNETFIYNSDNNVLSTKYTLVYIDSERLYFGQKSGANSGETPETRHSSISLDNYFIQIIN